MKPIYLLFGAGVVVVCVGIIFAFSSASHSQVATDAAAPMTASSPAATSPSSGGMTSTDGSGVPGQPNPNGGVSQRMRQMMAQLELTAAQEQQLQQIRATITDRKERREAMDKVLTPEQLAKLQAMRAQMKAERAAAPAQGGAAPGSGN